MASLTAFPRAFHQSLLRSPLVHQTRTRLRISPAHSQRQPQHHRSGAVRTMTSTTSPTHEYLVHIPDFPGTLPTRLKTKDAHVKQVMPKIESGELPYFGVTLSQHSTGGDAPEINGSIVVIKAADEATVRKMLADDPYTQAGVWDVEKAQIWAFKSG